jgi:Protein of unknown function (DUF3618)
MDGNTVDRTAVDRTAVDRTIANRDTPQRVAIYNDTSEADPVDTVQKVDTKQEVATVQETRGDDVSVASTTTHLVEDSSKAENRSSDEIERDIDQTQDRIADSIDELARRLSPTHMKDQALQSLNDSLNIPGLKYLIGDIKGSAGSNVQTAGMKVLEGIKHSPVSSALLGVGVGLAAVGGIVAARTDTTRGNTRNYDTVKRNTVKRNIKTRTYDERLRGMMETIENKDNDMNEDSSISGKLQGAKEMVSEGVQQAKEVTQQGAHRAKEGLDHVLEAQPLALGAVALLAGAAIGLLLPRTRYEDSFMGEKSDQIMSQAKDKASEVVDVAKSTVSDVVQTAKDTAGEVVQAAKDTAKETVRAATS